MLPLVTIFASSLRMREGGTRMEPRGLPLGPRHSFLRLLPHLLVMQLFEFLPERFVFSLVSGDKEEVVGEMQRKKEGREWEKEKEEEERLVRLIHLLRGCTQLKSTER